MIIDLKWEKSLLDEFGSYFNSAKVLFLVHKNNDRETELVNDQFWKHYIISVSTILIASFSTLGIFIWLAQFDIIPISIAETIVLVLGVGCLGSLIFVPRFLYRLPKRITIKSNRLTIFNYFNHQLETYHPYFISTIISITIEATNNLSVNICMEKDNFIQLTSTNYSEREILDNLITGFLKENKKITYEQGTLEESEMEK